MIKIGCILIMTALISAGQVFADLPEIKSKGTLRHLGVPYANFVTGSGDGMDVDLIKLFAEYIGVDYVFVKTNWASAIGDLTGKTLRVSGNEITITGEVPVMGDFLANGVTILGWRQKVVNFSHPTFPTQVWLVARQDSKIRPIVPHGNLTFDIADVKSRISGLTVLGKANTCLDPKLYDLTDAGSHPILFEHSLNELAPAILNKEAETTLLDVPDSLIALEKWPAKIKVIGPVSPVQEMGVAFPKDAPLLRQTFNDFLAQAKSDGTYLGLVKKYYPLVFDFYPAFFKDK